MRGEGIIGMSLCLLLACTTFDFVLALDNSCIKMNDLGVNLSLFIAQAEEEEDGGDSGTEGKDKGKGTSLIPSGTQGSLDGKNFSLEGMILYSYLANMYRDQELVDAQKKSEFRTRLKLKYGTENTYVYGVPNAYFITTFVDERLGDDYVYSKKPFTGRNLRLSTKASEASFNELYVHISSEKARLRVGNQIFAWGTADVMNPTSYFNPFDAREFLFKEEDEMYLGIPAVSAMLYFGTYVLELVYAPVHVPMAFPENQNFWFPRITDVPVKILVEEHKGMEINGKNMAYGARFSGQVWGFDASVSAYHGPDKEPVFAPKEVVFPPNELMSISVVPEYYVINKFGFDASMDINKFVFQCEAAYSPDKRGLEKLPSNVYDVKFPLKVQKSHYFAYSTGFNYFIPMNKLIEGHDGDSVFTFEWSQSLFLDSEMEEPILTKMIITRIEDTYFDGKLKLKIAFIYEARDSGYIFWPKAEWDFQNGLSIEVSYANISGEEDSFLYYYKDNDILLWKVRYTF